MVVSERHRGAGIGRSLVSAMEAWFNAHSCALFEVTSGDHREEAHRFYEGQGYRFDERRFLKIPD